MKKLWLLAFALLALSAGAQTISCPSGFTTSPGACSWNNTFSNTTSFAQNAGEPLTNAGAMEVIPAGAMHGSGQAAYVTAVNVQGFTVTFNFTPGDVGNVGLEFGLSPSTGIAAVWPSVGTTNCIPKVLSGSGYTNTCSSESDNGTYLTTTEYYQLPTRSTAITQTAGDNTTSVATDAFVLANLYSLSLVQGVVDEKNRTRFTDGSGGSQYRFL